MTCDRLVRGAGDVARSRAVALAEPGRRLPGRCVALVAVVAVRRTSLWRRGGGRV
jgi:hypothetical protein